jgi:NADH:ubiquinone oxidoreductase subunit C
MKRLVKRAYLKNVPMRAPGEKKGSTPSLIQLLIFVLGCTLQRAQYNLSRSSSINLWGHNKLVGPFLYFLKECTLFNFKMLIDLSMQDYIGKTYRFVPFYLLLSYTTSCRATVFTQVEDSTPLLSISMFFDSAG